MLKHQTRLLLLPLACLLPAGWLLPAQASASHTEAVYFEGSSDLLSAKTRPRTLQKLQRLGVTALRVELSWYNVAPAAGSATKPNFEATNPGRYAWGEYDALIGEADRLHWKVLLTITSPVPRWASSNKAAPYVTSPNDLDFEQFMTAVARHYSGRVTLFSIWNEPNHPAFLRPQFSSNGQPASPRIYRGLYQAGYAGLVAGGIAHPQVLMGETAPVGYDSVNVHREGVLHDVAPLAFLRGMLCLNSRYQKAATCGPLQAAGYAHHAYTLPAGPYYQPRGRGEADDVVIGVLSRLVSALNKAAAAHAIPAGLPIYLTEFGVQSYPNKELGVSLPKQAQFDAIDEHIAWSSPRVAAFSQYLLRDDPLSSGPAGASVNGGFIGFQTGLETISGQLKPLYYSWPLPLTVTKTRHGYALWGLVRPTTGVTKATVLIRRRGARAYRVLRTVTTNSLGYWSFNSSTRGVAWRMRWTSPSGVKYEGTPIEAY
jgi:tetrahydromethanopterin S-methyltransferase subunit F